MKIVIDMPNDEYDLIMKSDKSYMADSVSKEAMMYAIKNGTPLHKGCGRLIDAKALEDAMYHEAFEVDSDMQKWDSGNWIRYKMFENALCDAPTIIEADRER